MLLLLRLLLLLLVLLQLLLVLLLGKVAWVLSWNSRAIYAPSLNPWRGGRLMESPAAPKAVCWVY